MYYVLLALMNPNHEYSRLTALVEDGIIVRDGDERE